MKNILEYKKVNLHRKHWILKFVKLHKWIWVCGFLVTTIMTLINLSFPFLNGKLVDIAFYEKNIKLFLKLSVVYMGILFFNQFIVASLNNIISSQLMTNFVFDIRRVLFKKIIHKKGESLAEIYSGDMVNRMNGDTTDFMNLLFWNGIWAYSNILHIVFSLGFMFYYNIVLGVIALVWVPVVFYTSEYFKKKSEKINKEILEKQGKLSSYLFEFINNVKEVEILNARKYVTQHYIKYTAEISRIKIDLEKVTIISERSNSLLMLIAELSIFIISAFFITSNRMALGGFVASITYFEMAVTYFSSINMKIFDVGKQLASIQRVVDILDEDEEDYNEAGINQTISGNIEFKCVSFGYSNKNILNGINLKIQKGSTIGIVGKSGEGKTTLVNLLCKLYNVDDGEILIDGYNIKDYNLHNLRDQIGVVQQEIIIYNDTLRYNLCFHYSKENDNDLIEALKKAALYEFFLTLKDGLDTVLGFDGQELSGGQKQRIAIARIFVKNPKILIFDEATANLDTQNEEYIRNMIDIVSKNRTTIIIAHRLSTIKNCDKIAVLEEGKIQAFDSHSKLICSNETYINLFNRNGVIKNIL